MTTSMPTVTLNTGAQMPLIGFGTYQIPPDETQDAVAAALAAGYRSIDTAAGYVNEAGVGAAIAASGVARDDVFVTTKLWVQDRPADTNTRAAFEKSLERLGLDHVDLWLIHQPYGDLLGQWREMERIHAEGLAKAIGVSNFYGDHIVSLLAHTDVVPALNQIELHPFYQRTAYADWLVEKGIVVESWGGFAEGRNNLFTHPLLSEIGAAYGVTVAQVVNRWLLQRGVVAIPKSVRPERMAENIDVLGFELTGDDMERIASLDEGVSAFFAHQDHEWAERLGGARID